MDSRENRRSHEETERKQEVWQETARYRASAARDSRLAWGPHDMQ